MDFPSALSNNLDLSVSGPGTFLQSNMEYTQGRITMQGGSFSSQQGSVAVQGTGFDAARFQFPYQQPMTMSTAFPGGPFNQLVAQTSSNLQAIPVPGLYNQQTYIPQQQVGSLTGLGGETPSSFNPVTTSTATNMSAINMQMVKNSDGVNQNSLCVMPSAQNKMAVAAAHSLHAMGTIPSGQQVLYTGSQMQQGIQQMQEYIQRNQLTSVQLNIKPQPVSVNIGTLQLNQESSRSTDRFEQEPSETTSSHQNEEIPAANVPTLPSATFSCPVVTSLATSNISNAQETVQSSTLTSTSLLDRTQVSGNIVPDTGLESQEVVPFGSNDPQNHPSQKEVMTQQEIFVTKPSLNYTIKKHSPRQSEHIIRAMKPKSVLDCPSPVASSTPFFLLGRFGDQTPWKHHRECDFPDFIYDLGLDDNEQFEDDNHNIKPDPDEIADFVKPQEGGSPSSSHTEVSDSEEQLTGDMGRNQKKQTRAGDGVKRKSVISERHSKYKRRGGITKTNRLRENLRRSTRSTSASLCSVGNDEPIESVSEDFSVASTGESVDGPANASSLDIEPDLSGQLLQDSDTEVEEEDHGAVFPGMDLSPGASAKPVVFQVQPDIDDIPYLDNLDYENDMKRAVWQATKVRLEMERMDVQYKIEDSQCVMIGDQKRWQCHLCPKNYTTKHNLVTHILDHNGIKPHLCMVCGKSFKQLSHLNTHMLTHDNIKPHVCPLCGRGFTQVSHLKRHQAVHLDNKPNICDICNRGFAYPSELRVHKEKHIPGRDKCVDCGEDFSSPRLLKQHQATHEHREELTCNQCDRVFRYPSQLRDHAVSHTGSRPFICTECGMDFMKEHHLKAHMFTHTGLRPYSCQECGRAFNQKANLQRHMLIHSSERAYKCDQCDKTFTQPQTLKAHMVVHADKKPYWCNICGKEFGRLHNLQGHMHMHNNSKPYVCFCGSSFTLKGNLNRHKKVKHGLNESTESMEEEAVNFLNLMSGRSREEKTLDDEESEGQELNVPLESGDIDSPPLDPSGDPKSHRRERKSTPRKIPRHKKVVEGEDNAARDEPCDKDEEERISKYFVEEKTQLQQDEDLSSDDGQNTRSRKMRRARRSDRDKEVKVKDEENEECFSDTDDGVKGEGDEDEDWSPTQKRSRLKQGDKLDFIIAKKFQSV